MHPCMECCDALASFKLYFLGPKHGGGASPDPPKDILDRQLQMNRELNNQRKNLNQDSTEVWPCFVVPKSENDLTVNAHMLV